MGDDVAPEALVAAAQRAHDNAYAPYSGFSVGAALCSEDGRVFAGANVENASYGLSRCAEQSAVQALASSGGRSFETLVVVTDCDPPATPCGACRQILVEFAPAATVWLVSRDGRRQHRTSVAELLPGAFRLTSTSAAANERQ